MPEHGGLRLLGSLRRLRSDPLGLFVEAASSHDEVAVFRAAHRPVYLLTGASPIAHVTVRNRQNYVKGVSYDALRVPIRDALLTLDGPVAQERRRLLMPLFTRRWLTDSVPAIVSAVESHFGRWDHLASTGRPFNVVSEMNRLAFDVVGRVLLGTELGASMTELERLIDDASDWVAHRTRAIVPLPPVLPTKRNRAYRRAERDIRAFTEQLIATRRSDGSGDDMLSRLLSVRADDGRPLADDEIRDEIIGFLMAGHQTTGAGLAWTWYLLGHHPRVDERLADEIDATLGEAAPSLADLERIGYLGQVLDETMRLYPPGWAFTRTPLEEDDVAGRRIRSGAVIVISSYANQRSPRIWSDPDRFDPDRFAPERPAPAAHAYFPFGTGPHACIGKHLALIEAKVAMAMLVRRYRLRLVSSEPVAPTPGITLTPSRPILVRAERRRGAESAAYWPMAWNDAARL